MPYSRETGRLSAGRPKPYRRPTRGALCAVGALLMAAGAIIAPYPIVSMALWVPGLGIVVGAMFR